MAEQGSASSSSSQTAAALQPSSVSAAMADFTVPSPLKFLMSNLKLIAPNQLTSDNYHVWRLQIFQLFSANGFDGYLTGLTVKPDISVAETNPTEYKMWNLIEQNLVTALLSTISPAILPYILNLTSAREIWSTLELWLQPSNRSRVMQLKNELYHVQMKDLTMMQYLTKIKVLVDNIVSAGAHLDSEDIILHILNGLPPSYNPFKTAIRTSQLPITLDVLYSLLCSEEIHQQTEIQRDASLSSGNTALFSGRSSPTVRGRSNYRGSRGRGAPFRPNSNNRSNVTDQTRPTYQICEKSGHVAMNCWHRFNAEYNANPSVAAPKALLNSNVPNTSNEWILDSGASSHLTPDASNLQFPTAYTGSDTISTANGNSLPIQHTGQGILPLPESTRIENCEFRFRIYKRL
ncbi:hypothetical protein KFK09_002373 [Dendrobium nobile]|uniref:Retrovirus-related Pol polyprotein from transposon TNT 1-94 n=1 Tax=Dendrobium nobile TaxID=94219 RepID=A0A8T3C6L1_DENNO|nr:hypothetical protein KFK09_002373 [Dendrobium nobile]